MKKYKTRNEKIKKNKFFDNQMKYIIRMAYLYI